MQHFCVISNRFEQNKKKKEECGIGAQKSPKWDTSNQCQLTTEIAARLMQMACACLFWASEAFSHTFLLDYILRAQWIKTIWTKNIWRSYSDINIAIFWNVHGVTS